MKLKKFAKKLGIFAVVFTLLCISIGSVMALPEDETSATEVVATQEVTEVISTEAPTVAETEPVTEPITEKVTEKVTEKPTEKVTESVKETEKTTKATKETYGTTQAVTESLPEATVDTAPTTIVVKEQSKGNNLTYGFISWICVIVGVIAVVVILISNKTQYRSGTGKHRYDEGNKIIGQKRLLNDDYYNQRKTQEYRNKDTRK